MLRNFFALAAIVVGGLVAASPATPMIGGEPTGSTSYTNVGAFGVVIDGTFYEICSGTLVAPNVMLTAGHCTTYFAELEQQGYTILATFDPTPTASSTFYDAAAFYTHPLYVDTLRGNSKCGLYGQCTADVGLVELSSAVAGITPATLAPAGYVDTLNLKTQLFTIVGYGIEGFQNANTPLGSDGGTRTAGTYEALGQDVTRDLFLKLTGQHSKTATCFGDSGGPVFANGLIVGVVSFGQSLVCASNGYYTRVDAPVVANWLSATLASIASTSS